MISNGDGTAVRDYVQANAGAPGVIDHPTARFTNAALEDQMNESSSRGPNGNPDSLKPDVAAPGTRIMSAWSPDSPGDGSEFILISGTSMASPHVAGAGALIAAEVPELDARAAQVGAQPRRPFRVS